jgi:hypothetical protein
MSDYDSTSDTLRHIMEVRDLLGRCVIELSERSARHDASKLQEPEKSVFDRVTPLLKSLAYGSEEYRASLKDMGPAL